jgi:prefoldin subunit 5
MRGMQSSISISMKTITRLEENIKAYKARINALEETNERLRGSMAHIMDCAKNSFDRTIRGGN